MKTYRVERGPVSPPASLYGARRTLETGQTLRSDENSWIRRCIADGRLAEASPVDRGQRKSRKDKADG